MKLETLIANMKAAEGRGESSTIGGGEFTGAELGQAAAWMESLILTLRFCSAELSAIVNRVGTSGIEAKDCANNLLGRIERDMDLH